MLGYGEGGVLSNIYDLLLGLFLHVEFFRTVLSSIYLQYFISHRDVEKNRIGDPPWGSLNSLQ